MERKKTKPLVLLLIGTFGISFSPIFVKYLGYGLLGPTTSGFWRTLIGGITLAFIALVTRRSLVLPLKSLLWCLATGFFFSLDLWVWHRSIMMCGAGMATVLGNTQVFPLAIISYFLFKEKLTLRFFASAAVAITGIVLLVGIFNDQVILGPRYNTGILLGLITGIMYSLYLTGIKKTATESSRNDPLAIISWICFSSATFLFIASIFEQGNFWPPSLKALSALIGLGVGIQAISWWIITASLKKIRIQKASLVLLLQPVLSVIWGFFLFSEKLVPLQILGGLVTLAAVYSGVMAREKAVAVKT